MSRYRLVVALAALFLAAGAARADEGFWTFDNVPVAKIKAATGVAITPAWLERVQAASARLSVGCSSSMVSEQGLLLTNAHCVSDCAHDLAPPGKDYRKDGFLAASRSEERACPGLEADVLVSVKDISARMHAAGAGLTGIALVKARDALSSVIEAEECGSDRRFHCEVVDLYHGGQFKLYRYREYSDVRLVFSPGNRAAFFGGDPDNFNFPRYDLDCAFLRLYDDGAPVATPGHLRWNPAPPQVGAPTFISGNPGSTFREFTLAELETQRDVSAPLGMTRLSELRGRLIAFGETGPDNHRVAAEGLDEVENDYKVYFGRFAALSDPAFLAQRRAAEAELKARAQAALGAGLGDPWADTAKIQAAARALYFPNLMVARNPADSSLFDYARDLVRVAAERQKPSAERLPEYADGELPALRQQTLDPRPIEPELERINLEFWFSKTREYLGVDDPAVRLMLGDDSPESLAERLVATSRLGDPAVRKALWDGGMKAIEASDDPMIRFALKIDPEARRIRAAYEDQVSGPTARADEAIARARFAVYGDAVYPDGTFTLRLSYGTVAGWTDRGKTTPPFTTFAGLYARATGQPPFDLDPRWIAARDKLNPDTVFDFVTDDDIIGGNSGSPVLNARAEVIGAAFDGNIESLGGDYGWDGSVNRCVVVSAAAIQEVLGKIYHADALLQELAQ